MKYILLIFILLLSGCGTADYYQGNTATQKEQIAAWERQRQADRDLTVINKAADQQFATSILALISAASKTDSIMDDMMLGNFYSQYQYNTLINRILTGREATPQPTLVKAERPNDFVDGVKAFTPWIAVLAPWWGAAKMVGDAGYSMTSGGDMAVGSPGSFNSPSYLMQNSYNPITNQAIP